MTGLTRRFREDPPPERERLSGPDDCDIDFADALRCRGRDPVQEPSPLFDPNCDDYWERMHELEKERRMERESEEHYRRLEQR